MLALTEIFYHGKEVLIMIRISNSFLKEYYSVQIKLLNVFLNTWSNQLIVYDKEDFWDGGYIYPALNKKKCKREFLENYKIISAFLFDFFELYSIKHVVIFPLNKNGYCTDINKRDFIDIDYFNRKKFDIRKRYAIKVSVTDEKDVIDALIQLSYNYIIEFAIVSDEIDCVIIPSHHFDFHFVNYYDYSQNINNLIKEKYKTLCIDYY